MKSFLDYCVANNAWLLEFIEALVVVESPSDDPAAVNACGRELGSRLESIGGAVMRVPSSTAGDHLRADFGTGSTQILLLGHFDTVWPVGQLARMPLKREGGRLYGPGVFDMKAGIGLATLATRALLDQDGLVDTRLVMLWTSYLVIGWCRYRVLIVL
jgi:glutamate carboxypeptidase